MNAFPLPVVAAVLAACAAALGALIGAAFACGLLRRERGRRSAAVRPCIRDAMIDYVSGKNDLSTLREFARRHPEDFAAAVLSFQGSLAGGALHRLCTLAAQLGLVDEWIEQAGSRDAVRRRAAFARLAFVSVDEPCRRRMGDLMLETAGDPDPEVRLAAARALLHAGEPRHIDRVFEMALSGNVLGRALLAEDLRRHSAALWETALPEALRSSDRSRVAAALDLLLAWQRAIPLDNLRGLLESRHPEIRLRAMRLAAMAPLSDANRRSIATALEDPDPELRLAAVTVAGRLRMSEMLPVLARSLRLGSARVARAAALAMAGMPRGMETLEELSTRTHQVTAAAAREALARGRREAAR
jgi:HEAT repeat protein